MDATTMLTAALAGIAEESDRVCALIRSLPDATAPIRPGTWTVREAAVHLVVETEPCIELAAGARAPYVYAGSAEFNAEGADRIADVPETDPAKLADLVADVDDRLLAVLRGRPGDQPVDFFGLPYDLSRLAGLLLGELAVHGYDIATAVGRPWPIDPDRARLILYGYAPVFGMCVDRSAAAGHTASYAIEIRGGGGLVARFTDGVFSLEPPGAGPYDCDMSVDPVAFLLVGLGRVSLWQAISLGLVSAGGRRPELALGFLGLFDLP